jgi:hypothetical protein
MMRVDEESNMPEWKDEIKNRLASLNLDPAREAEIVEELSQHMEDRFAESVASGAAIEEAYRAALAELSEDETLQRELSRVERLCGSEPIVAGTNRRTNMIAALWQLRRDHSESDTRGSILPYGPARLSSSPCVFTLRTDRTSTLGECRPTVRARP